MLTRKQKLALKVIKEYIDEHGVAPSFAEMQAMLNLKSKTSIFHLMNALERRGYIRRLKYRARAMEIIRLPEDMIDHDSKDAGPKPDYSNAFEECVQIDLMGSISAGSPIEAIRDQKDVILVPASLFSGLGEHFALMVKGTSMINAGILDGDIVIIRRQAIAEYGDIVVAFVRGETATLKRIRRKGTRLVLEAANPTIPDQFYERNELEVQGKLIGLYRTY